MRALVTMCMATAVLAAQAPIKCAAKLTEEKVIKLLGDLDQPRIEQFVSTCGVSFELTRASEARLREAGAKDRLIVALRAFAPKGPVRPPVAKSDRQLVRRFVSDADALIAQSQVVFDNEKLTSLSNEWRTHIDLEEVRQTLFAAVKKFRSNENVDRGPTPFAYGRTAEKSASMHVYQIINAPGVVELGQFGPGGESPYTRYSLLGGSGYVSELSGYKAISMEGETRLSLPNGCAKYSFFDKPTPSTLQTTLVRLARALACEWELGDKVVPRSKLLDTLVTRMGVSVGVMAISERDAKGEMHSWIRLIVVEDLVREILQSVPPFPSSVPLNSQTARFEAEIPVGWEFTGAAWTFEIPLPIDASNDSRNRNEDIPVTHQNIIDKSKEAEYRRVGYPQPDDIFSAEVQGSHLSMPLRFYGGAGIYTIFVYAAKKAESGPGPTGVWGPVTAQSVVVR